MKLKVISIPVYILLGMCTFSCNKNVIINNQRLRITINDQMQTKIENTSKDSKPLMPGFVPSEYLVTKDFTAQDFKLIDMKKESLSNHAGTGTQWILTGEYESYPLKKIVYISIYKDFPNAAYFQVKYVNEGKKNLHVLKWVNNRYHIIPSSKDTTKFWSFQGSSHADRRDWIQKVNPGTNHQNFMGMNASDYGGGVPIVDLWRRDAGIAIGQTDSVFRLISIPVKYDREDTIASIYIEHEFDNAYLLKPEDTLSTFETFVSVHQGDCFTPLRNYALYMKTKGIKPAEPEPGAFEPVWCAWGYGRNFTVKEILNTLPKVKALGIKWVGIDDGYQQAIGDWHTNKARFPYGDAEMKSLVDSIHAMGLKAAIWWNPMAISPKSRFLKDNPNILLIKKDGSPENVSWWDSFYPSPTDSTILASAKNTVHLFIKDWGFDGLKLDGQNMNLCSPDYGINHDISHPDQAFQNLPDLFKTILTTSRDIDKNAVVEFCPCGDVMNFYIMPYTNQFVASDPTSAWQVRSKGLVYHALMPHTAYFGDHVELISDDFASQIGIGGVPGTKFVWPEAGSGSEKEILLTPQKDSLFKKWIGLYNEMMLSKGKYLGNLYDIGYDYPEAHCIEKDGIMYYAFYNPDFNGKIKLKGLNPSKDYSVADYFHNKSYGSIKGNKPFLQVQFKGFLMLAVNPKNSSQDISLNN
ncbi:MAG: alpha-galactosidase [Chitinophagaceae bacterium]|nr:MAG: alpha-galactosidase [Chitinophagaceae bacterium]